MNRVPTMKRKAIFITPENLPGEDGAISIGSS
jgi:hypothetical protein